MMALAMGGCVYLVAFLKAEAWIILSIQIFAGVSVYTVLLLVFRDADALEFASSGWSLLKNRRKM
jgi:hypothetical protein